MKNFSYGFKIVKDYILVIAPLFISLILIQREWDRYTLSFDNPFIGGVGHMILLKGFFFYLYMITKMYLFGSIIALREMATSNNEDDRDNLSKILTESVESITKMLIPNKNQSDSDDDGISTIKSFENKDNVVESGSYSLPISENTDTVDLDNGKVDDKESTKDQKDDTDQSDFELTPINLKNIMEGYPDEPQFTISLLTAYQTFEYLRLNPHIKPFKHIVIAALFHNIEHFVNKVKQSTNIALGDSSEQNLSNEVTKDIIVPILNKVNTLNILSKSISNIIIGIHDPGSRQLSSKEKVYASLIRKFINLSTDIVKTTPIDRFKHHICELDIIYKQHGEEPTFEDNLSFFNINSYLPWIRDLDIVNKAQERMTHTIGGIFSAINSDKRDDVMKNFGNICNNMSEQMGKNGEGDIDQMMKMTTQMMGPLFGQFMGSFGLNDLDENRKNETDPNIDRVEEIGITDNDQDDTSNILKQLRLQREARKNAKRSNNSDDLLEKKSDGLLEKNSNDKHSDDKHSDDLSK